MMKQLRWRTILTLMMAAGVATTTGAAELDKPACCVKGSVAPGSVSDKSLYQLDSVWTNQVAKPFKLTSLQGKPVVLTMFFAKCEYACPILVHDMRRIEAGLPESIRTNVSFVLVSFDSDRDTPEALARYHREHGLAGNWTLLRGGSDDVLELAALLGVKYKKDSRGQFAHSNVITVLNEAGEIIHQQIGLNQAVGETVKKIGEAGKQEKLR
jgi:protein SCO1